MINHSQNHLMHPRVAHNYADHGYYPTDDDTVNGICQRLDTRFESVRIFDSCCGTGRALADIAEHLSECGAVVESHGIELDKDRAVEAKNCLTRALHANFDDCIFQSRGVGLLFLNPPYGFGASDNLTQEKVKRLEERFFDTSWSSIQPFGVCVLIVPTQSLQKGFIADIAAHLNNIRVYRAAVETFNQVVIMGTRPAKLQDLANDTIKAQIEMLTDYENAPLITDADGVLYEVPATPNTNFKPLNRKIEGENLFSQMQKSKTLWHHFENRFSGSLNLEKRRPLMPLSSWHTALALAAGQVEGIVKSENGRCLLVKGSTHKTKDRKNSEDWDSKGNLVTVITETDKFVPCIKAIDLTRGSESFGQVLTIS